VPDLFLNKPDTTIQDLIDAGFPLDKPFILVDPDTNWLLLPHFLYIEGDKDIAIMSDYGSVVKETKS
jgi:hypothetical protein